MSPVRGSTTSISGSQRRFLTGSYCVGIDNSSVNPEGPFKSLYWKNPKSFLFDERSKVVSYLPSLSLSLTLSLPNFDSQSDMK